VHTYVARPGKPLSAALGHDPEDILREAIAEEDGRPIYRYSTDSPLRTTTGNLECLALFAGQVAGSIETIPSVLSFGGFAMNYEVIDIILRLGAAAAVGVIIGINRDLTNKPIGMRTLGLVSLGAAVASLATIQFQDLAAHPDALSRVVQHHPRHHGRDKLYRCGCHSTRCSSRNRRRINDGSDSMGHSRTRDSLRASCVDNCRRRIGSRPHTARCPWLDGRRVFHDAKAIVDRATKIGARMLANQLE
jgi:hypothetical protein